MDSGAKVLTLNGGSSSLKFALHEVAGRGRLLHGKFDRLGSDRASFRIEAEGEAIEAERVGKRGHREAVHYLFDWLHARDRLASVAAIGHRIVHGGKRYRKPERIDSVMVEELRRLSDYASEHLPAEIAMIEACRQRLDGVLQVACFDTAFHRDLPLVARLLPIPRRFAEMGVERYGFHGLSYTYLLGELRRLAGDDAARGRLILAHLGNGASLAAVRDGKSIDTTMGFTPAAGIPMSTRAGDLDPGLVLYLAKLEGMDAERFDRMVNHQSGLIGLSETSSDVRDLLGREAEDHRAAEALAVFCHRVKKAIGSFAAALGGLDTLIFSGGIGENSPAIRERICAGLDFLGIALDDASNGNNSPLISSGTVAVRVIPTDEEAVIVKAVVNILEKKGSSS